MKKFEEKRAKVVKLDAGDVRLPLPQLPVLQLPGFLHRAFFTPVILIGGSDHRRGSPAFQCSTPRQALQEQRADKEPLH